MRVRFFVGAQLAKTSPLRYSKGPILPRKGTMEYLIDDLARRAGMTVRNVRAYQERGLLAPPRKEGRVGYYNDAHLARLRLIGSMLERSYTLANIQEMVDTWEQGYGLHDLLGLEEAVAGPFSREIPTKMSMLEVKKLFPDLSPSDIKRAIEQGIVEREGVSFRVPSPQLLHAAAELHAAGIPLSTLFDEFESLRQDVDHIAHGFVGMIGKHLLNQYRHLDTSTLNEEDLMRAAPEVAEMVRRIRPLAEVVVNVALARALEEEVRRAMSRRFGFVLDKILNALRRKKS